MNNTDDSVSKPSPQPTGPSEDVTHSASSPTYGQISSKLEKFPKSKKSKKPVKKLSSSDIYKNIENCHIVDQTVIDKLIDRIEAEEDPAPLLASLLKDFMDGVKPPVWSSLRERDVPARFFECLCRTVGIPGLGDAWRLMGRDSAPNLLSLLHEYVPPTKDAATTFLKDRSMLPLTILIYRAFRNDDENMGLILRDWVAAIAKGCEDQEPNSIKEAQRTGQWLLDLASMKSNPSRLLAEVAPPLIALRLGSRAFGDVAKLTERLAVNHAQLVAAAETETTLRMQLGNMEIELEESRQSLATVLEELGRLKGQIEFIKRHADDEKSQAAHATKEKLAKAIQPRTENIRLLINRQEPNIEVSLTLLSEIEGALRQENTPQ